MRWTWNSHTTRSGLQPQISLSGEEDGNIQADTIPHHRQHEYLHAVPRGWFGERQRSQETGICNETSLSTATWACYISSST
jgi:hypothetical protein